MRGSRTYKGKRAMVTRGPSRRRRSKSESEKEGSKSVRRERERETGRGRKKECTGYGNGAVSRGIRRVAIVLARLPFLRLYGLTENGICGAPYIAARNRALLPPWIATAPPLITEPAVTPFSLSLSLILCRSSLLIFQSSVGGEGATGIRPAVATPAFLTGDFFHPSARGAPPGYTASFVS